MILNKYARYKRLQLLLKFLHWDDKILDIGAGDMWLCNKLKGYSFTDVMGIDIFFPKKIYSNFIKCDARGTPFKDNRFDKVIAIEVLEHVDCIEEIKRILKPGGRLIITIPNPETEWLLNILIKLKLVRPKITPHVNKVTCKDIPMKMIYNKKLFCNMGEVGVFENE